MGLAENIKKRRIELQISQDQLANLLGYKTRSSIAKIEKGISSIPPSKLTSLANILNTTTEYLLTGKKEPSSPISPASFKTETTNNTKNLSSFSQKNIVIILAGGQYRTDKHLTPYQFIPVNNKPIITYTMETYQKHPEIDSIYVVSSAGWHSLIKAYAQQYGITKLKDIILAGNTGVQSIKNAIDWISRLYNKNDIILLQESTRPLITYNIISNVIHCCSINGTGITFTSLNNTTPFLINKNTNNITPVDAYSLINIQSPEAYTLGCLQDAFFTAEKINHELTETICAYLMNNLGKKLTLCEGSNSNIRIIDEENLLLFETLVANKR